MTASLTRAEVGEVFSRAQQTANPLKEKIKETRFWILRERATNVKRIWNRNHQGKNGENEAPPQSMYTRSKSLKIENLIRIFELNIFSRLDKFPRIES